MGVSTNYGNCGNRNKVETNMGMIPGDHLFLDHFEKPLVSIGIQCDEES